MDATYSQKLELSAKTYLTVGMIDKLYSLLKSLERVYDIYCISARFNLDVFEVASAISNQGIENGKIK